MKETYRISPQTPESEDCKLTYHFGEISPKIFASEEESINSLEKLLFGRPKVSYPQEQTNNYFQYTQQQTINYI
jgi:hypothetical protein